jgi:hypothetical protein
MESLAMLGAARILVKTTPENRLVSRMGGTRFDGPSEPSGKPAAQAHAATAERVGAIVERVARTTPWRSMCLEQALAGKWMLRRRGIDSTMYVGMARRGEQFVAHAWLVSQGQTLTGAGTTVYATLAAFHEPRA